MAVRRRGKRWVADYYDNARVRRWKTFDTREAAKDFEAEERTRRNRSQKAAVDPAITLKDYADRWLGQLAATAKPSTVSLYRQRLDLHVLPTLGRIPLRDLGRKQIRDLLVAKLTEEKKHRPVSPGKEPVAMQRLSSESVRIVYSILRALFSRPGRFASSAACREEGTSPRRRVATGGNEQPKGPMPSWVFQQSSSSGGRGRGRSSADC
jgi:hypothetical protein